MRRVVILTIFILSLYNVMEGQITGVTISGVFNVGEELIASVEGTPISGDTIHYEWFYSDNTSLGTDLTYTIIDADQGEEIYVTATEYNSDPILVAGPFSSSQTLVNSKPTIYYISISGIPRSGMTLNGSYIYSDDDSDPEGTSQYMWYESIDPIGGSATEISGETSQSLTLTDALIGSYIGFSVTPEASVGSTPGDEVFSPSWIGPVVANSPPVATIGAISGPGTFNVNDVLIGNYEYSDTEGDVEDGSVYEWWNSPDSDIGNASVISGATGRAYKLTLSDTGKYIFFKVTPVAKTGTTTGSKVESTGVGPVNTPPYVTSVNITGNAEVGSLLTGNYVYHDGDGDAEGSSIYKWYRNGTLEISGATNSTYTVTGDDESYTITFEVTPVSSTGYPDEGSPIKSSATSTVIDPSPSTPVASQVCIQGIRAVGTTLTGKYLYTFATKTEGTSSYRWLRNNIPISGATSIQYTLTQSDIDSEEDITFEVTPKSSNNPPKIGTPVQSNPLARIVLAADSYSIADPPFTLMANVGGGIFSGPGVSESTFSPADAGSDASPHTISYLLNIVNSSTTCSQTATDQIAVIPITTYFDGFNNIYCHDNGPDTITVVNVPPTATSKTFDITDPNGIVELINDTTIVIDPGNMKAGTNEDILYFSYTDGGSVFPISKSFIIDKVGTVSLANLDTAYCEGGVRRYVTVENATPSGGSGVWTGVLMTDRTSTSAFIEPSIGTPGISYPVTYQYTSPFGCKSNMINKSIKINPLPNSSFSYDPIYNLDGGPKDLIPVTPGGTFIIDSDDGISGTTFWPALVGLGPHNITYQLRDANGCSSNTTVNVEVKKVQGTYTNLPAIICYEDKTYNIIATDLPSGITINSFTNSKSSLVHTPGSNSALYYIPDAGAGNDTINLSYTWDGVDYTLSKAVFVDLIGDIAITNLKDNYCDYAIPLNLGVTVVNSTANGTFSFSGSDSSFVDNGNNTAIFYPAKTLPSEIPYIVGFVHQSRVVGSSCRDTVEYPVTVNKSPEVSIINDRITVNKEESPFVLKGIPEGGIFRGNGVGSAGDDWVFTPFNAELDTNYITYTYTDSLGCYSTAEDTLLVYDASGDIEGINSGGQYCFDGPKDTLIFVATSAFPSGGFSGPGIENISRDTVLFDPSEAGEGDHEIVYIYYDFGGAQYKVSADVNVDLIKQVTISIDTGQVFCNNDPLEPMHPSETEGGVFIGPVTNDFFDPSKAIGDTSVTFIYTNPETGCSNSITVPVVINPAPLVSFVPADFCIENSSDTTWFINNTTSEDTVSTWEWEFSDAGGKVTSALEQTGYLYSTGGLHKVALTAKTTKECSDTKEMTFDLGIKPIADFYLENECFHSSDSVTLIDATFSTASIVSRKWNFFYGETIHYGDTTWYKYVEDGYIPVEYIVNTGYENCHDTIFKNIYIRPTVYLGEDNYYNDFESGMGGWVKDENSVNSWSFGTPDRQNINTAASGDNAWFTGFDVANQVVESSSVESPCFDFSESMRPMLKLKLWKRFDSNRDGASIQYKIGDEKTWQYVGTLDDGINWYNSTLIKGRPGGDQLGWTTVGTPDIEWIESLHELDELKGSKDVKFRIAYGSDGNSLNNDGVAFDDIWIGERTRNVLLEYFVNTSSIESSYATEKVNTIVSNNDADVINIQYHTNFPGDDPFYNANPGDVSARIIFYGLTKAPYSFIDGGTRKDSLYKNNNYANISDYVLADIDSNDIKKRSLINPLFNISLSSTVYGESILSVSCKFTALSDISTDNLTLYIVITEKENGDTVGARDETMFYNVFRKFIPDAGGINLKKVWKAGDTLVIPEQAWLMKNIKSSDIEVVAFVQNNNTKELYQAVSENIGNIAIGIEPIYKDKNAFAIFPNPASDKFRIGFGKSLAWDADIWIYNSKGILVKRYIALAGTFEHEIDCSDMKNGIYLIRVTNKGMNIGFKKLIISGN